MKFRKRLSVGLLTGAMALSLAAPAFAEDKTVITATYTPITLAVTVPATGQAIINPYGLPYAIGEQSISGQQITTLPLTIQNKSAVPLNVSASVTVTKQGNMTFVTTGELDTDNVKDKKGQVVFQMFSEEAETINQETASDKEAINALAAKLPAFTAAGDKDIILDDSKAVEMPDIVTLREGTTEKELQNGGAAFFRLAGKLVKTPVKTASGGGTEADPWTSSDSFAATIAFTFEPKAGEFAKEYTKAVVEKTSGDSATYDLTTVNATATLQLKIPAGVELKAGKPITWTSDNEEYVTVTADSADTTGCTASVKCIKVGESSAKTVTITANFINKNGVPCKASMKVKAGS